MSASGKSLLGLWLYKSGEQEWAVKEGSPIHKPSDFIVCKNEVPAVKLNSNSKFSQKRKEEPQPSESGKEQRPVDRTSIIFTLKNQVGGLARALQVFHELGINVLHVEFHASGQSFETVLFFAQFKFKFSFFFLKSFIS